MALIQPPWSVCADYKGTLRSVDANLVGVLEQGIEAIESVDWGQGYGMPKVLEGWVAWARDVLARLEA